MSKGHGKGKGKDKSDFFQIQNHRISKYQVMAYSIDESNGRTAHIALRDMDNLSLEVSEEEVAMLDDIFLD